MKHKKGWKYVFTVVISVMVALLAVGLFSFGQHVYTYILENRDTYLIEDLGGFLHQTEEEQETREQEKKSVPALEPDSNEQSSSSEEESPSETSSAAEEETETETEMETEEETQTERKPVQAETKVSEKESESETTEPEKADNEETVKEIMERMSLEEKVAQLFVLAPEALTNVSNVTMAGDTTRAAIDTYPVGGLIYFENNIWSEDQCSEMIKNVQKFSDERIQLPMLICTDEEGGTVTRISGRGMENVPDIPSMYTIGQNNEEEMAYQTGSQIGSYLSRFGFNVDLAPVADVFTNENNPVIGYRSFGNDPELVARMVSSEVKGLKEQKIAATLKHFPGHGDTESDSHYGAAYSYKTLEELRECEWLPFKAGIEAGADLVMMGHISLPNVTGDSTPASLSYKVVTKILREELGFEGVVITDAMNMGAVSNMYTSAGAAVAALKAGVDLVLMPVDFPSAYQGVLSAVEQRELTESRIDQSLARIIRLKLSLS